VDEVNIVSASISKAMGAHRAIARVFAPVFRDLSTFDYQEHFRIDRMLSLEHLTALELANSLRDPGSIVIEQFARGSLEAREIVIREAGPLTDKKLVDLQLPSSVRVGTIRREQRMWIASANDHLQVGDGILVFSRPEDVPTIKSRFGQPVEHRRTVVIAGGGETGFHLARTLERERFKLLLLEANEDRCQFLARHLNHTEVVHADASRREVLKEERVGTAETFIACLGNDQNNILAGVEARDLGTPQIMAVISRPDYAQVVGKLGIDVAVSEREVMARQIMSFLQKGNVVRRQTLPGGNIELIELDVTEGSHGTQTTLAESTLPAHCLLVALFRKEFVRIPTATDQLKGGDRIVLLVEDHDADGVIGYFSDKV
ncbi:MAG: Trk system potassium transporter TrkA, partial [Pirellulaceae bacterium]